MERFGRFPPTGRAMSAPRTTGESVKATYSNLDILRAIAVSLVVGSHVAVFYGNKDSAFSTGALGVMLFFVHTSLVLMHSLEAQPDGPKLIPFMIRRSFRIYPLAVSAISVVVLCHIPQAGISVGRMTTWPYDSVDVVVNLFLVQGLTTQNSIIGPFWSLSFEMQMYVVLPLIFVLLSRCKRTGTIATFVVILLASAVIDHYSRIRTLFAFAPCFLAGIAAYQLQTAGMRPFIR